MLHKVIVLLLALLKHKRTKIFHVHPNSGKLSLLTDMTQLVRHTWALAEGILKTEDCSALAAICRANTGSHVAYTGQPRGAYVCVIEINLMKAGGTPQPAA